MPWLKLRVSQGSRESLKLNVPVDVVHAIGLDAVLTEDLSLTNINRAKTNVDELLDAQAHVILEPSKVLLVVILGKASEEGHGHAVDVAAVAALRGVDVGMSIDPNDGDLAVETLTGGLGSAGNGSNGNAVVTTESESHAALSGVLIGLRGDLAGDGRGVAGLLHATVVGVRLGDNVVELLDGLIAKDLVAELLSDLRKETSLDKRGRAVVDTGLGLEEDTSQHTLQPHTCENSTFTVKGLGVLPDRQRIQRQQHQAPQAWRGSGCQ